MTLAAAISAIALTTSPMVHAGTDHPRVEAHDYRRGTHTYRAELQRALDAIVEAGAPGAVVLVRDGNRTIRLASGLSDITLASQMHAELRTRIGGLTKTFTASVILQLVGEGQIGLDDTVERWLPGAIPNGADVTVRQLLNHTSGIYDYAQDPTILAPYFDDLTLDFDPMIGVQVAAQHGPLFDPGTQLAYSNTNYLLLAMVAEHATGRAFATELHDRIIKPLHLAHTSYPTDSAIRGRHIHGYLRLDDATTLDVTALNPTLLGAAGGVLSNAHDVADFYRALMRGDIVDADELDAMTTIDPVATGGVPDSGILGGGWGLGLLRETFPCGDAWGHDSENLGYMSAAWSSRDATRQVIVLVNTTAGHDEPISVAMRDTLVIGFCEND